jgi:UDP-N-acetylglucosamine 4,6-dehydratase (inverting)
MSLNEKVILVTGGTGSFGTKFAEVVLREHRPKALRVFSRGELLQMQMARRFDGDPRLRFFIGDVRDPERLHLAMKDVDVVVHAAALKHVPACEYNPFEAVQTNIAGAKNVIDAALSRGVQKVLAISTDKAVNPVNLYGATKLCAEKLFVQGNFYAGQDGPRFSCARYGNVLESRGSVVAVFKEQRSNGKITVTDGRMTRFWLTVETGVRFVLGCIDRMQGGEVFVPKIPSMRMMDLVEGVAPGCAIDFVGIRPGEKLHEILISRDEARQARELDDGYLIEPAFSWWKPSSQGNGRSLPDDFEYRSDTNDRWLSIEELRRAIADP